MKIQEHIEIQYHNFIKISGKEPNTICMHPELQEYLFTGLHYVNGQVPLKNDHLSTYMGMRVLRSEDMGIDEVLVSRTERSIIQP